MTKREKLTTLFDKLGLKIAAKQRIRLKDLADEVGITPQTVSIIRDRLLVKKPGLIYEFKAGVDPQAAIDNLMTLSLTHVYNEKRLSKKKAKQATAPAPTTSKIIPHKQVGKGDKITSQQRLFPLEGQKVEEVPAITRQEAREVVNKLTVEEAPRSSELTIIVVEKFNNGLNQRTINVTRKGVSFDAMINSFEKTYKS